MATTEKEKKKPATGRSKKTTAKSTAKDNPVVDLVLEEKPVAEENSKSKKKKYEPSDLILCKNYFGGMVMLEGRRTHTIYIWDEMGEEIEVEYQDLMAEVVNSHSSYIYDPLILVQDSGVYENRKKVKDLYASLLSEEDIKNVLRNGNLKDLEIMLKRCPESNVGLIKTIAATMIENNEIENIRIVRTLDEVLGTSLTMMIE